MAERPLIVTGCQKSGTAYIAAVLTAAGHWCSHERLFRSDDTTREQIWSNAIESSHAAAPAIESVRLILDSDIYVVHQVRHPLRVVSTLMANGKFRGKTRAASARWAQRFVPEIVVASDDGITSTIRYVIAWNRMVEARADQRWRVEDVTADQIIEALTAAGRSPDPARVELALSITDTRINARPSGVNVLGWDDLPDNRPAAELAQMTADYGYPEDPTP